MTHDPTPDSVQQLDLWQAAQCRSGLVTIQQRFEAFDKANPAVYRELRTLAIAQLDAGVTRGSIAGLFEVVRYNQSISTQREHDPFKLNNDLRAPYARALMKREPRLAKFFSTRKSEVDRRTKKTAAVA